MTESKTFVEREIEIEVTMAKTGDVVTIAGLRTSVDVQQGYNIFDGQLNANIEGMTLDSMKKLTVIGFIQRENINNIIVVRAGDKTNGMQMIFKGIIWQAYIDANRQPSPTFNILAKSSVTIALSTPPASSYRTARVEHVFADLAREGGLSFRNINIDRTMDGIYLEGSTLDKIKALAKATGSMYSTDNGILTVWANLVQVENKPVVCSPDSQDATMIGYPIVSGNMLEIIILFTSRLQYHQRIEIKSELEIANGLWTPVRIIHQLQAKMPGGAWFTHLTCDRAQLLEPQA